MRYLLHVGICAAVAVLFASQSAHADLHTWKVNEIFSSADGTIQFIEFKETAGLPAQQRLSSSVSFPNHTTTSTSKSFTFLTDLPSTATANKSFLIATPGFAALPGAVTPDYTFSAGQTPFFSITGDTLTFSTVDSFAFTGAQLSLDGHRSLLRTGSLAENSPTNFAGATGHIDLTPAPEPSSLALAAVGSVGALLFYVRRRFARR